MSNGVADPDTDTPDETRDQTLIGQEPLTTVLVVGRPDRARALLESRHCAMRPPVRHCECADLIPIRTMERGTLIVWHVERLDPAAQLELASALENRPPNLQIIAVTAADLYEQVVIGGFSADLYYRLNTILVRADPDRST